MLHALAALAPGRPAWLRVTTTSARSGEEAGPPWPIRFRCSSALTPSLRRPLQGSEAAVFCLAPSGERRWMPHGSEGHFLRRHCRPLAPWWARPAPLKPSCCHQQLLGVTATPAACWRGPPLQPRRQHGELLRDCESRVVEAAAAPRRRVAIWRLGALYGTRAGAAGRFTVGWRAASAGNGAPRLTSWIHRD